MTNQSMIIRYNVQENDIIIGDFENIQDARDYFEKLVEERRLPSNISQKFLNVKNKKITLNWYNEICLEEYMLGAGDVDRS